MNSKSHALNVLGKNQKFQEIIETCQELLYSSPEAESHLKYLDSRIKNRADQKKFQFGFLPPFPLVRKLLSSRVISNLKDLSLYREWKGFNNVYNAISGKCHLEYNNLIFPIKNEYDQIVGLSGRTLLSKEEMKEKKTDKYKNSFFIKNEILFGLNFAKEEIAKTKKVFLTEGQVDTISAQIAGLKNVVSVNGTSLSIYQIYLLKKFGGPDLEIGVLFDNDSPGDSGFSKICSRYNQYLKKIQRIRPSPEFSDIDEMITKSNLSHPEICKLINDQMLTSGNTET